jgi:hypothetical protein
MLIPAASATRTTRIHRSFTVKYTGAGTVILNIWSKPPVVQQPVVETPRTTGIAGRCEKKKRGGGEKRQYDPCKT